VCEEEFDVYFKEVRKTLLRLCDAIAIPTVFYGCEKWTLRKLAGEELRAETKLLSSATTYIHI
jgi:hypothetical protein